MKTLMAGTLLGIVLTLVIALTVIALAPPNLEIYEDVSFIYSADIPFTPAWSD